MIEREENKEKKASKIKEFNYVFDGAPKSIKKDSDILEKKYQVLKEDENEEYKKKLLILLKSIEKQENKEKKASKIKEFNYVFDGAPASIKEDTEILERKAAVIPNEEEEEEEIEEENNDIPLNSNEQFDKDTNKSKPKKKFKVWRLAVILFLLFGLFIIYQYTTYDELYEEARSITEYDTYNKAEYNKALKKINQAKSMIIPFHNLLSKYDDMNEMYKKSLLGSKYDYVDLDFIENSNRIPVAEYKQGKYFWGFADSNANCVISCKYKDIEQIQHDTKIEFIAVVKKFDNTINLINKYGDKYLAGDFLRVNKFDSYSKKALAKNTNGDWVEINLLKNDAFIRSDIKDVLVDKDETEYLIKYDNNARQYYITDLYERRSTNNYYAEINSDRNSYCIYRAKNGNNSWVLINAKGEQIGNKSFEEIREFQPNGLAIAKSSSEYYYLIDTLSNRQDIGYGDDVEWFGKGILKKTHWNDNISLIDSTGKDILSDVEYSISDDFIKSEWVCIYSLIEDELRLNFYLKYDGTRISSFAEYYECYGLSIYGSHYARISQDECNSNNQEWDIYDLNEKRVVASDVQKNEIEKKLEEIIKR